ncbi:FAD/NAD(P)-binding domain-containing protein [Aspergillus uvarum CBS 121591]|uniref:monoamine oxidase n=1 Tax=Aspergillus uvarum CBS 121591 TaxID=1448315 RepID=A0A319CE83_9EURO|nr:FAD/NAD(P)-binding domain-containing protein [Aspergillus uvarum CBS 121591]PYH76873.1 FAD/NAD(P)-binding domain-containing protein [Aspergillus uvarum CBS 121591]
MTQDYIQESQGKSKSPIPRFVKRILDKIPIQDHYDVIVFGAGFAGLTAARDRIGGRTWTAQVHGEEIEMGGTWVHWNQPHLYAELHRYGLHRNLKTSAGTFAPHEQLFKSSGAAVEKVSSEKYGPALERVAQRVFAIDELDSRALMPYPHDPLRAPSPWKRYDNLSVQDRKELFASNVSTFGSAPAKETGFTEALRWFALGGHSMAGVFELAGNYKLGRGGMTSLARAILSEYVGDISFGTIVAEMSHVLDGVEVRTQDGRRFGAGAVVSTIPLNCLGDVQFNPPLSPLRQTAFVFAFSDHNGTQPSESSGTWCIGFGYNGHLTQKTDSEYIVQRFKRDIKPDVTVEAYATHDWMNDPYAKGVWACWGPNSASVHLQELQKPHGRILFAGADWADGWRGFIDGAIERGQVAVRDTVQLLKETSTVTAKL